MNRIIDRIESRLGLPGLSERIARDLSSADIGTFLLDLFARLCDRLRPAELRGRFSRNRFVRPSPLSPIAVARMEVSWLEAGDRHGFTPLLLSPLAPLGTISAITPVHQNNVVSAVRGTEVVSDATNVLALQIATDIHEGRNDPVIRYCATHRHVRGQFFDAPGFTAHFSVFCMASGGRSAPGHATEIAALREHLTVHATHLPALLPDADLRATLYLERDAAGFVEHLRDELPAWTLPLPVDVEMVDTLGNYYHGARFKLWRIKDGERFDIGDGGLVDWTQRLLGDRKQRLVISGTGIDLVLKMAAGEL